MALGALAALVGSVWWVGQCVSVVAFPVAQRLGLQEGDDEADELFLQAERGTARWDAVTLWTLPLAGAVMLVDDDRWPVAALVAGAIHVDAGGREAAKHASLRHQGVRVGSPSAVRVAASTYAALTGLGLAMMGAGAARMSSVSVCRSVARATAKWSGDRTPRRSYGLWRTRSGPSVVYRRRCVSTT